MRRNEEVAAVFDELADRLLLQGESWFKVRAYRTAAASMRTTNEPVEQLSAEGRLGSLLGVGKAVVEKTAAYLATGSFPLLDRARAAVPDGRLELLRIGLAPAVVRWLHTDLGIDSLSALRDAVAAGRLHADPRLRGAVESALALRHS